MDDSLQALMDHLLATLHHVAQQLGQPHGDSGPSTAFADALDSMGMVEFLARVAKDCGTTVHALEACVHRQFTTVRELAIAMHAEGMRLGSASRVAPEPPRSGEALASWLTAITVRLPDSVQSAEEVNTVLQAPPGWLESHAGIVQRRVWKKQDPLAAAVAAAQQCLDRAGLALKDVSVLLVTSEAPPIPLGLAAAIHHRLRLGTTTVALETGGACTGFLSALWTAQALLLRLGCVLIVSVEAHSKHLHIQPGPVGEAAALFGDGAAAVLLCPNRIGDDSVRLGEIILGVDGSGGDLLRVQTSAAGVPELHMKGITLAGRAVNAMAESVVELLQRNHRTLGDIAAIVSHGGNGRMPGLLARRLGIAPEMIWSETYVTGNLGSASLPVAWALREPKPSGLMVWTAVGAGLMWGAALLENER